MGTKFLKGLLMALIGALVAAFNTDPIVWSVVIVTLIGTAIVYTGKNAFYQSDSDEGTLNLRDMLSALLILIGTAIISAVASIAGSGTIDWLLMLKTAAGVIFTYLGSTVFSGQPKAAKK